MKRSTLLRFSGFYFVQLGFLNNFFYVVTAVMFVC